MKNNHNGKNKKTETRQLPSTQHPQIQEIRIREDQETKRLLHAPSDMLAMAVREMMRKQ